MEIGLRRLEGVKDISISMGEQTLRVDLEPGTPFPPAGIREALGQAEVTVKKFSIVARGFLETGDDFKQFFVTGPDRFKVAGTPITRPPAKDLRITAEVDDLADPMEVRITKWEAAQ